MDLRALTIEHESAEWHEAFLQFVPKVFPSIGFRRWRELGGWDERYVSLALAEGDRIVANASLCRMDLVLNGEPVRGWQLGAVGTLPEYRNRGLQARLLPRLLEHTGASDLVFLFANDDVLEFYPRFGFARVRESLFRSPCRVMPEGPPLRALDLESAEDRALLQRVAARAEPVTTLFGARDYGNTLLWYWANFLPHALRYALDCDAIFVVAQDARRLRVLDIQSASPVDLSAYLPRLVTAPTTQLEFGFTPTRFWPSATPDVEYTESPLFVRGPHRLSAEPFKYPMLAQT